MPEIATAPSPVIASSNGINAAKANTDGSNLNNPSDAASTAVDPFSAMLQRLVKSQGGTDSKGDDAAKLALLLESGTSPTEGSNQDAMASLIASLQAQMLGLQPSKTSTDDQAQGDLQKAAPGEDTAQIDTTISDPTGALASLMALATLTPNGKKTDSSKGDAPAAESAKTTLLSALPTSGDSKQQLPENSGKEDLSLAAKPAILAPSDLGENQAAAGQGREGEDSFQTLLESARNLQAEGSRPAPPSVQTHNVVRQETRIETPVGHQQWAQEVGDKVSWLAGKQESRAELVLNPPQMGRIEVSITMNGDHASASFNTSNPAVREALESALPRLREVLADAGVRLDQAQVGSDTRGDSPQQQQERRDNSGRDKTVVSGDMIPGLIAAPSGSSQWIGQGNGMVDTFA